MAVEVYYFSGTGNSLAVAKDIAQKLGGTITPLAWVMDRERITPEADAVGIVFPVHNVVHDGLPPIIGRFIGKLENLDSKYIFAVCTCGGGSAATIANLGKLIEARGGRLAAGFTVKMPMNLSPVTPSKQWQRRFDIWKKRLGFISGYVGERRRGRFETINPLIPLVFNPLFAPLKASLVRNFQRLAGCDLPLAELFPLMDRGFRSDSGCNGCGICAKICPVENIEIIGNKPSWRHHCENCFACLAWCPRAAIQSAQVSSGERYRHPEVELADMLRRL